MPLDSGKAGNRPLIDLFKKVKQRRFFFTMRGKTKNEKARTLLAKYIDQKRTILKLTLINQNVMICVRILYILSAQKVRKPITIESR